MKYLFVGGCPRSGTTALMEVLNSDERIAVGMERFKHQAEVSPAMFEADYFLRPRADETNVFDEHFYSSLADRVRSGSLAYIGDKVPGYFRRLEQLRTSFPSARLFLLIRDPVRVACSFNRRSQRPSNGWSSEKDHKDAVRQWNDSLRRANSFITSRGIDSLFLVKYEWLFCGDERYLGALYGYLGLDLSEETRAGFRQLTAKWPRRQRKMISLTEEQVLNVENGVDLELAGWADRIAVRQIAVFSPSDDDQGPAQPVSSLARTEQWNLALSIIREGRASKLLSSGSESSRASVQGASRVRQELERVLRAARAVEASRSWGTVALIRRLRSILSRNRAPARHDLSGRIERALERARLHEEALAGGSTSGPGPPGDTAGFYCPVCGTESPSFLAAGKNKRPNAKCPKCFSLERHRLLWLIFERELSPVFAEWPARLLHLGAEPQLEQRFRQVKILEYLTGDLTESGTEFELKPVLPADLPPDHLDVIICSGGLETVGDDRAALAQLRRILRPGGQLLIQTRLRRGPTIEDLRITSPEERRKAFGRENHVRTYGRDIVERLASVGFEAKLYFAEDVASPQELRKMALGAQALVHCRKGHASPAGAD